MHFQTSTGNSSGPTALPFFILFSAFFTSPLLTNFRSSLTTSASSVPASLSFSSFISFSKYSFHLSNTASELTITLTYSSFITFMCYTSFPTLFLCLANLYNSFSPSFLSNLPYKSSYARPFAIATAFFALLFFSLYLFSSSLFNLLFYPMLSSPLSFLLFSSISSYAYHVSQSPFCFPNVTVSTVSAVFFSSFAVLSHSSGNPSSPL